MSARLIFIVEGLSEENFVNRTLGPYLAERSVFTTVTMVTTRRGLGRKGRGGGRTYYHLRQDLIRRMRQDRNADVHFTTMFDLYRLPKDFPGFAESASMSPVDRVKYLEAELSKDILADVGYHLPPERFLPHIQLYEFETLIFADPSQLVHEFITRGREIRRLVDLAARQEPETIDDGDETAPSRRIIAEIPEYEGSKASAGPNVVEKIGLNTLRERCPHFNQWLCKMEALGV